MKKQLITVDNLDEFVCKTCGTLYAGGHILTPGAKDELAKRHVTVERGECPAGGCCGGHGAAGNMLSGLGGAGYEKLLYGIASILQSEYGVADPEQLKEYSLQAVKVIKENL